MSRKVWAGFAVLCLLQGAGLLLDQFMPPLLPGLMRLGVHDGLLAVAFSLVSRKSTVPVWTLAGLGIALFGVPQVLFAAAGGHVDGFTELLVTLLGPVIVVVVSAQRREAFGPEDSPLRLLAPAVVGIGGAVLVLPFYLPASRVGQLWLAVMVLAAVAAGVAAVRIHTLLQGVDVLRAAALVFGAVSVVALGFCWVDGRVTLVWDAGAAVFELLRLVVVEGPILLLTVWLLREMKPERFAARPLLVVLVMIVESFIVEHPTVGWTMVVGVLLIGGGAWGLLRVDSRKVL